ncbi:hypothetical protein RA19_08645 [Leisingera sp. ANG-M1]|nr:hypothetical protein RA19_08645 [Leisingera sp. ANG-M1]
MPTVRITTKTLAACAILAASTFAQLPALADGLGQPLISTSGPAVAAAETSNRTFQLAYGQEIGSLILGGSVAREHSGVLARAVQADEARHLRLLAGYDFGPATGFVSVGRLQARSSGRKTEGPLLGLGMRVSLNRALQLTGELLHHEAGTTGSGAREGGETLSVTAAFRF